MLFRKSLAAHMAKTVVLLTLAISLVIGSFQVILAYHQKLADLDNRVQHAINSVEKAAVKAVYTFDNDLAAEVASGLFEFPPVSMVNISDDNGQVMANMVRYPQPASFQTLTYLLFKKTYVYEKSLYLRRSPESPLGHLYVEVSPNSIANAFWRQALTIMGGAALISFIISILLFTVFHKLITVPLQILTKQFQDIDPRLPQQFTLEIPRFLHDTEFQNLTTSGNNLLKVIGSHLRARDLAEIHLKRQQADTERYLRIAEAIILQLDINGRVQMINQRGLDVLGYKEQDLLGQDWFAIALPENERIRMKANFLKTLKRANSSQYIDYTSSSYTEHDIITSRNQKRRIFWHNDIEINEKGMVIGLLSSGQDITARKEAEDALRQTEGSLRTIIEATSEGFAIIDIKRMQFNDVNASLINMLGYNRKELLAIPLRRLVSDEDWGILRTAMAALPSEQHRSYELYFRRKDGTNVPVEINASTLPSEDPGITRSVAFISNITARRKQEKEQKQLELQLRQAQKMETIGTLAGGIAHDFNNILTPILGYASLLVNKIPKDDPNHKRIQQISISAHRAADMVKQILTFSRRSEGEMESCYVQDILEESLQLVRNTMPANVELVKRIDKTCAPIMADPTQIQQLILNLCTNAAHAMKAQGGLLTITLGNTTLTETDAENDPNVIPGDHVVLTIHDTGTGIDKETLTRIFDPFFTTKKSGEGTGLGLAMVHGIVLNHKGTIHVESQIDEGTLFTIHIPTTDVLPVTDEAEEVLFAGDLEHILIVDDEVSNTDFLEELLDEAGYQCSAYNDSLEMLDAFVNDPYLFNLIITDQNMPKLTGDQLIRAVREIRSDIPIIMISGYDQRVTHENADEFGVDVYLQKPVTIQTVTQAVNSLLKPPLDKIIFK